jgi:hypothetical protein
VSVMRYTRSFSLRCSSMRSASSRLRLLSAVSFGFSGMDLSIRERILSRKLMIWLNIYIYIYMYRYGDVTVLAYWNPTFQIPSLCDTSTGTVNEI